MPACPHCHQYYFGEPDSCPKCHYHFKERRVVVPEALKAKQIADNEEKERKLKEAQQLAIKERDTKTLTLLQNAHYEYQTELLFDSEGGMVNKRQLDHLLNTYAKEGWKLHSVFVNEIGKNSHSSGFGGISIGTNETVDVTVLIFERCIKPAEYKSSL